MFPGCIWKRTSNYRAKKRSKYTKPLSKALDKGIRLIFSSPDPLNVSPPAKRNVWLGE